MNENSDIYGFIDSLTCMTDLHLHLDGAISLDSAKELAKMQGIAIPESDSELETIMRVPDSCSSLHEFLLRFAFPCSLLMTYDGLKKATMNLLAELKEQGVMYAELRFAPYILTKEGMTQEEATLAVIDGMRDGAIPSSLILCCMRNENDREGNTETVLIAEKYLGKGVAAIDLAGNEAANPTADFAELFAFAKEHGVPYVIHAGEADGAESVRAAVDFGAKRIGHGIRSLEDGALTAELAKKQLPLEICPTSNVCTAIFNEISEYPIRKLLDAGLYVTINTDDPAIEGTNIKQEYKNLVREFDLTKSEIRKLLENSVNASFASEEMKTAMLSKIASEFDE